MNQCPKYVPLFVVEVHVNRNFSAQSRFEPQECFCVVEIPRNAHPFEGSQLGAGFVDRQSFPVFY